MEQAARTLLFILAVVLPSGSHADAAPSGAGQSPAISRDSNVAAGKSLLSGGRYPEAMDRFEAVLRIAPLDEEVRNLELKAVTELAVSTTRAGYPEASLEALKHARSVMPDSSQLLIELSLQALELKRFSEAEEALRSAQGLRPQDLDISYALARLEIEEQHMPQAEAHLRAYLSARPRDASAHYGLGHVS